MKRIQIACLNQTLHFQLRSDVSRGVAERDVKAEYENYKAALENSQMKYKIVDEQVQKDGSIIVKVKKQIGHYDIGDYLD
jgi:hypothetical protein